MNNNLKKLLIASFLFTAVSAQASPVTEQAELHITELKENFRIIDENILLSNFFVDPNKGALYKRQQEEKEREVQAMIDTLQIVAGFDTYPY